MVQRQENPDSLTHSLTRNLSVFTAFSASQPNNKLRRRAALPYRGQQHKSVLLQWFSGNRSVRREWLAPSPAAPAQHLATWNRKSDPLFHISLGPNKSSPVPTAVFSGRLVQISWLYLLVERLPCEPLMNISVIFLVAFFFFFLAGINQGSCYRINHFPDDNDYDTDSSEYLLRKCFTQSVSQTPTLNQAVFQQRRV